MSDTLKVLSNIRSLRALAREITLEQLLEIQEKIDTVVTERKTAEAETMAAEKERLEKLEKYRAMLINDGIDPEELMASLGGVSSKTKTTKKRVSRPAKYKYIDEDGSEKTWTGQGRTPKVIRDAIEDNAKNLDDFLI